MKATDRMDGTKRATVQVSFHIQLGDLVTAAMEVISYRDGYTVETLSKNAIERELRGSLWYQGDTWTEFGREQALPDAIAQEEAIYAKVLELYPSFA